MSIYAECRECGASINARPEDAGRRVRCRECGGPIRIPEEGRRRRPQGGGGGRSRGGRPGNRRRKSSGRSNEKPAWLWPAVGGGGVALLAIVGVVAYSMGGGNDAPTPSGQTASTTGSSDTSSTGTTNPNASSVAAANNPGNSTITPTPGAETDNSLLANAANTSPTPATQGSIGSNPSTGSTSSGTVSTPTTTTPPSTGTTSPSTGTAPPAPEVERKSFDNLADLVEIVEQSVVRVSVETDDGAGSGSGFVVNAEEGIIVTNRHVLEGARQATVVFAGSKQEYRVTHFREPDTSRDICIAKIACPADRLKPVPLAAKLPRKGEDLVAFGAPLGLDFTATKGIMSATRTGKDLEEQIGAVGHTGTWIQHSVPTSPGNSGGPLVNMKGEVVAMNTMILLIGQNLNFAISSVDIREVLAKPAPWKELRPGSIPVLAAAEKPKIIDIAGTD